MHQADESGKRNPFANIGAAHVTGQSGVRNIRLPSGNREPLMKLADVSPSVRLILFVGNALYFGTGRPFVDFETLPPMPRV
jgi:hypothetical protein